VRPFYMTSHSCAGPVQGASDLPALGECHLEV
jgi:hypothetical protein